MNKIVKVFIICFFSCLLLVASFFVGFSLKYPVKYKSEITYYSNQNNLSACWVASLINAESSFKKDAYSNKGAIGLMQIKLSTAQYMIDYYKLDINLQSEDLFDIDNNLKFGCLYLKYLTTKFDDFNTVLACYNAGETIVRSWLKNDEYSTDGKTLKTIPFEETNKYIKKINKNNKIYQKIFKN